jgi:hypothetical protein
VVVVRLALRVILGHRDSVAILDFLEKKETRGRMVRLVWPEQLVLQVQKETREILVNPEQREQTQ